MNHSGRSSEPPGSFKQTTRVVQANHPGRSLGKSDFSGQEQAPEMFAEGGFSDRLKDVGTSGTVIDVSPEMPMNRGMEGEGEGGEG